MARIKPIRVSENDKKEHARLVRNARAKIRRTLKNHNVDLSNEVNLPSIKSFSTRKEFNEWKKQTESFTNRYNLNYQFRTNPYGVTASKKRINDLEVMRRREQANAKKELKRYKDLKVHHRGKPVMTVEQETLHMSKPSNVTGIVVPKDFKFNEIRNKQRLDTIERVGKERVKKDYYDLRHMQMKDNFIKALETTFDSEAKELIGVLEIMDASDFYELYLSHIEFDFDDYFYDGDGNVIQSPKKDHIDSMLKVTEKYYLGEVDMDFKGF